MDLGKKCSKCGELKSLDLFHKSARVKDGRCHKCKSCISIYDKTRQTKRNATSLIWYHRNSERLAKSNRQRRLSNLEVYKSKEKKYQKNNPDKCRIRSMRRSKRQSQATPTWLSREQKKHIKRIYRTARILSSLGEMKYVVDHIHPIYNKNLCGLHVPWNLQILTAEQNAMKGTKT